MNTTTQALDAKEPHPETVLPERTQTARKYRAITKTALAARLGVSARAVTTYETLGAPFALAHRLAEALRFPPEFFFTQEPVPSVDPRTIYFAPSSTVPSAKTVAATGAVLQAGTLIYSWVEDNFNIPDVSDSLDPALYTGQTPQEASKALRRSLNIALEVPVPNLMRVCESIGIRVLALPNLDTALIPFSAWNQGKPYIFISQSTHPYTTRTQIASLIGKLIRPHDTAQKTWDQHFAQHFLLPFPELAEYIPTEPDLDVINQATHAYQAPASLVIKTLKDQGLITEWKYRTLRAALHQHHTEPNPQYEHSHIFHYIYKHDQNKKKFTAADIANDLHIPREEIIDITFNIEPRVLNHTENPKIHIPIPSTKAPPRLRTT